MMQKLAISKRFDMMFDLDTDPFEMNNLLGFNAMNATDATIIQAEHMRCLLLDWMTRLDGTVGYYSVPAANYGQGNGDISEIRDRQSWKAVGFWTSSSDSGVLEMGNVAWTGDAYVRHEWLYMGTRMADQSIRVSSMTVTGQHANRFTIDDKFPIDFSFKSCVPIRISFSSATTLASTPIDASLVIQWSEVDSTGAVTTSQSTETIRLTMKNYDFESQNLGYPPPPTIAPTISPAPTNVPTILPTINPTTPSSPSTTASGETTSSPSTMSGEEAESDENGTTSVPPVVSCGPDCVETNDHDNTAVPAAAGSTATAGRSLGRRRLFVAVVALVGSIALATI
ncbi:hypothetical protein IV203_021617 [Nitzschia inconspicua]|uniref:Uncharacterized protein n=1 Tax=Nitzschia inconspicua TaxID=303405 RepID=A0A9K3KH36_9STRA|nr:hypothetical protein IV203_021617 [Nitzschia inconspicua]